MADQTGIGTNEPASSYQSKLKQPVRKKKPTRLLDSRVSDTKERHDASKRWLQDNYFGPWAEVFGFYKNKTPGPWRGSRHQVAPGSFKRMKGRSSDRSKTNICLPDTWVIGRKKSSRMSSRPPAYKVRANTPQIGDSLSAWLHFQWDRGNEQKIQRRHILQAQLFGLSVKSHWWDSIVATKKFRYGTEILMKERGLIMDEETGSIRLASADENDAGLSHPIESFTPEERAQVMAGTGDEVMEPSRVVRWEGPVSGFVFIGDFYPEPEFETLHSAAWIITDDYKDVEWLAYMSKKMYLDPETGDERPVFEKKAIEDLIDMGSWDKVRTREDDFKEQLRDVIFQTRPQYSLRLLPGKRFLVSAEDTFRDGVAWRRWVANERILLGEMPYPFDLYGHYAYSSLTPIPDLLYGIGDSPLVMMRALQKLHNISFSKGTDSVINRDNPILLMREGADAPSEILDRNGYRVLTVKSFQDFQWAQMPPNAPEAWEHEKRVIAMMERLEPALNEGGAASQAQPDPRKPATLALLQKAGLDSLSADEMAQLDMSLAEEAEIKLYMLQQNMRDQMSIPMEFLPSGSSLKAGDTNQTGPRVITIGPMDIQQDLQVFSESYSTLALDDIDKQRAAERIYAVASQNPRVFNLRKAAELYASTFRGHTADELLNQNPPPPMPPIRLTIAWKDLSESEKQLMKQRMGLMPGPNDELAVQVEGLEHMRKGADHLQALSQPADAEPEEVESYD